MRKSVRPKTHIELKAVEQQWLLEQELAQPYPIFAGVDEAGRGCLAGPVVAAAVILGGTYDMWVGIQDSKEMSKSSRVAFYHYIKMHALGIGVGMASPDEIDKLNILQASRLAMGRALHQLPRHAPFALVDGTYAAQSVGSVTACLPVIDGDARCLSIAAASIIAKVKRDCLMCTYAECFPDYGFEQHAGYGTRKHLDALRELGPTPIHRYSFAPIRRAADLGSLR